MLEHRFLAAAPRAWRKAEPRGWQGTRCPPGWAFGAWNSPDWAMGRRMRSECPDKCRRRLARRRVRVCGGLHHCRPETVLPRQRRCFLRTACSIGTPRSTVGWGVWCASRFAGSVCSLPRVLRILRSGSALLVSSNFVRCPRAPLRRNHLASVRALFCSGKPYCGNVDLRCPCPRIVGHDPNGLNVLDVEADTASFLTIVV